MEVSASGSWLGTCLGISGQRHTRLIHDQALDKPLLYFAADGTAVESEFPQPINEVRENLRTTLFLNAYDCHPVIRPFRRFLRRRFTADPQLMLEVPDLENEIASVWQMTIGPEITTMVLVGTEQSLRHQPLKNEMCRSRRQCVI